MKKLSRDDTKRIMGGYEPPTSYTCTGEGFGSETYDVSTQQEAQQYAVASILAGQCWNVGAITCSPNYFYNI